MQQLLVLAVAAAAVFVEVVGVVAAGATAAAAGAAGCGGAGCVRLQHAPGQLRPIQLGAGRKLRKTKTILEEGIYEILLKDFLRFSSSHMTFFRSFDSLSRTQSMTVRA